MERKILLKTVRIYKYCPKCPGQMVSSKTGICTSINSVPLTMTSQGVGFAAYKCSYQHTCDKCGFQESYDNSYPYIDYIEDGTVE